MNMKKEEKNDSILNLIEITPKAMECLMGACPAIFKTNKESFILIGKKLTEAEVKKALKGRIGKNEIAIEIPKGLLSELRK